MKWHRTVLTCAVAALTALAMTGLTPVSARASTTFTAVWWNAQMEQECLGVLGGDMTNGTAVVAWPCIDHPDQKWEIQTTQGVPGGSIWGQIRNFQNPDKCLGVLASTTFDGSRLVIWDCNGHTDQYWFFQPAGSSITGPDGCFNIENYNAFPKVIGILNADPTPGAQTVIWDILAGHHDQAWCPTAS
jgi:hypothetical protein